MRWEFPPGRRLRRRRASPGRSGWSSRRTGGRRDAVELAERPLRVRAPALADEPTGHAPRPGRHPPVAGAAHRAVPEAEQRFGRLPAVDGRPSSARSAAPGAAERADQGLAAEAGEGAERVEDRPLRFLVGGEVARADVRHDLRDPVLGELAGHGLEQLIEQRPGGALRGARPYDGHVSGHGGHLLHVRGRDGGQAALPTVFVSRQVRVRTVRGPGRRGQQRAAPAAHSPCCVMGASLPCLSPRGAAARCCAAGGEKPGARFAGTRRRQPFLPESGRSAGSPRRPYRSVRASPPAPSAAHATQRGARDTCRGSMRWPSMS